MRHCSNVTAPNRRQEFALQLKNRGLCVVQLVFGVAADALLVSDLLLEKFQAAQQLTFAVRFAVQVFNIGLEQADRFVLSSELVAAAGRLGLGEAKPFDEIANELSFVRLHSHFFCLCCLFDHGSLH